MNNTAFTPVYMMAKAAGAACNLACRYCYYLDKQQLYPAARPAMSDATLEAFVRQYIEAQPLPQVSFCWHGGEALLRPVSFYRKAMELQLRYGRGRIIDNCLQTNGTLLTDEWCRFFKDNGWLVGISVDGPAGAHDAYRRTPAADGTHARVMRAIEMLQRHGVEWNALAVVNDANATRPLEFYRFFRDAGCRYLQFTPIVERNADGSVTPFSVTPACWGDFLCGVFDEWVRADVGSRFVQIFDATLARWLGAQPGLCSMAETCGHAGVVEHNGDVYSCDHFVDAAHLLGNIHTRPLGSMMHSARQRRFGLDKRDTLPAECRACRWLFACNGECPKNRFAPAADGTPRLNYLCAGYRRYFDHVAPYMDYMKAEILAGRPPSSVMTRSF